ncbi:TetR/AcrR family transcriptional regulator [Streptosporangiaceae bacterium NEAU-GS5]|nr:TetR/AcrR family transcriptional regulator [Streptosporangiaceae bacterium NEAU-GS5]
MQGTGESRSETQERIIETATRLFASLGYDGTPLHMIADAAGVDVGAVTDLVGDKRDIYLTVMERVYLTAQAAQDSALAEAIPGREGAHLLADRFLDFCVEHPEEAELWIHRWLGDAADVPGLEALYLRPLLDQLTRELHDVIEPDVDLDVALWTVIWCVRGFVVGGVPTSSGQLAGPRDIAFLRRFAVHLHLLVDRMFRLTR